MLNSNDLNEKKKKTFLFLDLFKMSVELQTLVVDRKKYTNKFLFFFILLAINCCPHN